MRTASLVLDSEDKYKRLSSAGLGLASDITLAVETTLSFSDLSEIVHSQISLIQSTAQKRNISLSEDQKLVLQECLKKALMIDGFRKIILSGGLFGSIVFDAMYVRDSYNYKYQNLSPDSDFFKIGGAFCQGTAFFLDYCLTTFYSPMIKSLMNIIKNLLEQNNHASDIQNGNRAEEDSDRPQDYEESEDINEQDSDKDDENSFILDSNRKP